MDWCRVAGPGGTASQGTGQGRAGQASTGRITLPHRPVATLGRVFKGLGFLRVQGLGVLRVQGLGFLWV